MKRNKNIFISPIMAGLLCLTIGCPNGESYPKPPIDCVNLEKIINLEKEVKRFEKGLLESKKENKLEIQQIRNELNQTNQSIQKANDKINTFHGENKDTPAGINWSKVTAITAVCTGAATILAVTIAFFVYIANNWWNTYRYLADVYYDILKTGIANPDFINPRKTQKYKEFEGEDYHKYKQYALMCWAHAEDIYVAKPVLCLKKFKKIYVCTFKRYVKLHFKWFCDNESTYPNKEFVKYIKDIGKKQAVICRVSEKNRWDIEALDYDKKVLSPFLEGVTNPLYSYIKKLDGNKVVADMGCGNGKLVEILASKFNEVIGIDYSSNMIEAAKKRCNKENVTYKLMDMTNLGKLNKNIDIAFSINSILPSNPKDTLCILKQIHSVLKPKGLFIGILPSFDAVLHLKNLYRRDVEKKLNCKFLAKQRAQIKIWYEFKFHRKLNIKHCLYADDFINTQRFIHDKDIKPILEKTGFQIEKEDKVIYPWNICMNYNYGYFPDEKKQIWDCFVVARKKS